MLLRIQDEYSCHVGNYIKLFTGNNLENLKTKKDVKKMIKYMLRKGNLVINADDERLLPTPYNLNVNKKHFIYET